MANRCTYPTRALGFSMVEVLVTLVIVMLGLLGLLGVQVRSHQAEFESYQRSQALILVADMVDRINANRKAARCYEVTTNMVTGTPFLGATGAGHAGTPSCAAYGVAATQARAVADMTAWNNMLQGSAETSGGTSVGAMIGARGCVSFDPGTNEFTVSVAWQGAAELAASAVTCAQGLYGQESQRRVVSQSLRIADLK